MTHEEARQFVARIVDGVSRRDIGTLMREYAENCRVDSPTAGAGSTGLDAVEQVFRTWFVAFPDLTMASEQVIVDGDDLVHLSVLSGTDHGGFMGLPPSHKAFRIHFVAIYTLNDGKIVRERRVMDFTGFLVQIGVLKAKPA